MAAAFLLLMSCAYGEMQQPRVIVLGFDGLDPVLCRQWMSKGRLPHLSQLARDGDFRELGTSYPAQSPVAWRTFATGVNPGGHGIYDTPRLSKQQLEALKSLGYLH